MLQPWWFCSCLAWKLLELLVLRFMLQPWWFCSCLAWKFLELLVLRFMLQPWWFCSCLAWKLLELLVLRFMLQLWWFCSCLAWKFLELLVGSVQLVESTIFHCAVSTSPFCFHGSVVAPPLLCTLCYCAHWRWGFGVWRGSAVIRFYELRLFVVLHFLVLGLVGIFWVRILCHRNRHQLCTCDAVIVVMSLCCLWMHLLTKRL